MPPSARLTNVAPSTTSFVGRDDELRAIDECFERGERLVTLLGPPGVGKTRLARRYVEVYGGRFTEGGGGGAWACELTDAADVDEACRRVGRALGAPLSGPEAGADVAALLGDVLAERGRLLLVFDNVEHLAGGLAVALGAWLDAAPGLHVLATSRQRLRLAGETLRDVGPLPVAGGGGVPAAVRLFVDRARAVRADFSLEREADARAVEAVVRRLDGLPLAIELAAARSRVLAPARLWHELSKGLEVLEAGPRNAAPRHDTLGNAVAWSWALLSPAERAALAQASTFRGGLSLAAAEAVLDLSAPPGAPPVLDVLASLCDHSLLYAYRPAECPDEVRYGLYESVRAYAAARLCDEGGAEAAAARHARHFFEAFAGGVVPRPTGRGGLTPSRELVLEAENLLAAYRWSVRAGGDGAGERAAAAARAVLALEPALVERGPAGLYLSLVDEVLAEGASERLPPALRARARLARGEALLVGGLYPEAIACFRRARDEARAAGEPALELHAFFSAANAGAVFGAPFASRDELERALAGARSLGDPVLETRALGTLGIFELVRSMPSARAFLEEAQRVSLGAGEYGYAYGLSAYLGAYELLAGRPELAHPLFARSAELWEREGRGWNVALCLLHWGVAYADEGRYEEAGACAARALALHRELGDRANEGLDLCLAARVAAACDDLTGAHEALEGAERTRGRRGARALGALLELARGHVDLARARRAGAEGDAASVARHLEAALGRMSRAFAPSTSPDVPADSLYEVRLALRGLERALAEFQRRLVRPELAAGGPPGAPRALRVTADARRFQPPGGPWVDFSKRAAPRLVLKRLVEQRLRAPGSPLPLEALIEAGWPGQRPQGDSGPSRLHMALHTLRKHGLEGLLVRRDDGYLLDPSVGVVAVPDPDGGGGPPTGDG